MLRAVSLYLSQGFCRTDTEMQVLLCSVHHCCPALGAGDCGEVEAGASGAWEKFLRYCLAGCADTSAYV